MDTETIPEPLAFYRKMIAANLRACRARRRMSAAQICEGMIALGFPVSWRHRQTADAVFTGRRRVTAEEIIGLAKVMDTRAAYLLSDYPEDG